MIYSIESLNVLSAHILDEYVKEVQRQSEKEEILSNNRIDRLVQKVLGKE